MLLRDHLHQCVACRHAFEGKVVAMPAPAAARTNRHAGRLGHGRHRFSSGRRNYLVVG